MFDIFKPAAQSSFASIPREVSRACSRRLERAAEVVERRLPAAGRRRSTTYILVGELSLE